MTSTIFPAHGGRRCVEVSAWRSEIYAQEPSSTRRFLHPGLRNVREKLVLGWCREGDLNPHNPFGSADFKSAASASFAIPARKESALRGARLLSSLQQAHGKGQPAPGRGQRGVHLGGRPWEADDFLGAAAGTAFCQVHSPISGGV